MTATKTELRLRLRAARERFVEEMGRGGDLLVAHLQVAERVTARIGAAKCVSAYLSDGFEVDPLPILFECVDRGIAVALPRVNERAGPLSFHHWLPGDPLLPGPLGLMQPSPDAPEAQPDLILTPLVGFDRAMNRLGQGGGYYDRTLALQPEVRRIGLGWSVQEVEALPFDAWDMLLNAVATEREWIEP